MKNVILVLNMWKRSNPEHMGWETVDQNQSFLEVEESETVKYT
jgi:hypothetical protein